MAAALIITERMGRGIRLPSRDVMLSYVTSQVGHGWGFGLHCFGSDGCNNRALNRGGYSLYAWKLSDGICISFIACGTRINSTADFLDSYILIHLIWKLKYPN